MSDSRAPTDKQADPPHRRFRSRRFFLEGFRRSLLLGLLGCLLAALVAGSLAEFWLRPGPVLEAVKYESAMHYGEVAYADLDFDGFLDRLRESPTPHGQASFSLETGRPGEPQSTGQFYYAGADILRQPYCAELDADRRVLALLTQGPESLRVRLNLQTFERGGARTNWSCDLPGPDWPAVTARTVPSLSGAMSVERGGRPWLYLGIVAPYEGWRGGLLVDPGDPSSRIDFPNGLQPTPIQDRWLRGADGRVRWLMGSSAVRNGNACGGIPDDRSRLFLFDPDSGFVRQRDFGPACTTLKAFPLPDRRHALLVTKQEFELPDGRRPNVLVWDSAEDRVAVAWRIEDLVTNPILLPDGARIADKRGRLRKLDAATLELRTAGRMRLPSTDRLAGVDGYWIGFRTNKRFTVHAADGALQARIDIGEYFTLPRIEHGDAGLGSALLHVATAQDILSYRFEPIPWWRRLAGNPWLPLGGLLAFLGLLTALSRRISLQERVLRGIVESGSEAVGILDRRGRVLYANARFQRDADPGEVAALLADAELRGQPALQRLGERWIRWSSRPLLIRGQRFGSALLGVDESARITQQEMQLLVNFSGILSHELKNPLTPIQREEANLRALLAGADPELRVEADESLDQIRLSVATLRKRIRSFIDLVKIDDTREPVDLAGLVEQSLADNLLPTMSAMTVDWRRPDRAVEAAGSSGSLQAMLNVLVANALEAMARRGTLTLDVAAVDGEAVIRVGDSGGGIPDGLGDGLWAPGRTTKAGGLGHGLYFARNIARAHGGEIEVETTSTAGTTMRVRLPLLEGGEAQPQEGERTK